MIDRLQALMRTHGADYTPRNATGVSVVRAAMIALGVLCVDTSAYGCSCSGRYDLFFGYRSVELSKSAQGTIAAFRKAVRDIPSECLVVTVEGHIDGAEEAERLANLDEERAARVRHALLADLATPYQVVIKAIGTRNPLVRDAAGMPEPQNRRAQFEWDWVADAKVEVLAPMPPPSPAYCCGPLIRVTLPDGTICLDEGRAR